MLFKCPLQKNLRIIFCFLVLSLCLSAESDAKFVALRTFDEVNYLGNASYSKVVRVPTARVVIADYELINADFPETRQMTHAEIDSWFIRYAGYMTEAQIKLGNSPKLKLNDPIASVPSDHQIALVPRDYKRARVYPVGNRGLLDGKGVGAGLPTLEENGLLNTTNAVREFFYSKAVGDAFEDAELPFGVVGSYGVIDWGFYFWDERDQCLYRAGAVFRQAHARDVSPEMQVQGQLKNKDAVRMETVLRKFGLSSASKRTLSNGKTFLALNIQGTKDGMFLVDFGSYKGYREFLLPSISLTDYVYHGKEMLSNLSNYILFSSDPGKLDPQPIDELKFPFEIWGDSTSSEATALEDRKKEGLWLKIEEQINALSAGQSMEMTRTQLSAFYQETVTQLHLNRMKLPFSTRHYLIKHSSCDELLF